MSILAVDWPHFLELLVPVLLVTGTLISIATIVTASQSRVPLRPPPDDSTWTLFLILIGGLGFLLVGAAVSASLLKAVATREVRDQIGGLIGYVEAIIGTLVLNSLYRHDGIDRLGLSRQSFFPGIGAGVLWLIVVLPWVFWTNVGVETIMTRFHIQAPTMHEIFRLWESPEGKSLAFRAAAIIGAVIVAPVAEEILFRGLLQTLVLRILAGRSPGASEYRRSCAAVVITSALFASIHSPMSIQPAIFVLAIGLGLAYERRGNLWTNITMHVLFNAFNFSMFLLTH